MGSGGFLVSAMDIMIKDAQEKIKNKTILADKIKHIKERQLLGIEILGNIYILAILNMILMGDGCSMLINGDSKIGNPFKNALLSAASDEDKDNPLTNIFLLNPPYSAPGKGLIFVDQAFDQMKKGRAVILIQDSAGSGQGECKRLHICF